MDPVLVPYDPVGFAKISPLEGASYYKFSQRALIRRGKIDDIDASKTN